MSIAIDLRLSTPNIYTSESDVQNNLWGKKNHKAKSYKPYITTNALVTLIYRTIYSLSFINI